MSSTGSPSTGTPQRTPVTQAVAVPTCIPSVARRLVTNGSTTVVRIPARVLLMRSRFSNRPNTLIPISFTSVFAPKPPKKDPSCDPLVTVNGTLVMLAFVADAGLPMVPF